jgi:Transmembrane protein 131-like
VLQNTGNLPMTVDYLLIDDKYCQSASFVIENCHGFTLKPGEQHYLHMGFTTDFTIAKLKRKLTLESK